jgi:serine protease AprX
MRTLQWLGSAALLLSAHASAASERAASAHIDLALLQASTPQPALVVFTESSDWAAKSKAFKLLQGDEKTQAVFAATFARDASLKARAQALGFPDAERFWLVNALFLPLDRAQASAIARADDVKAIYASVPYAMQQPSLDFTQKQVLASPYGVSLIKAPDVWALGFRGQSVVIAGADTGFAWTHPALRASYRGWDGSVATHDYSWYDGIRDTTIGSGVGSTCTQVPSNIACDDGSHGTHTMGTMVGDDGANEQIGVAPGARWIGCRNMNIGNGRPDTYLRCMQWLLAPTDLAGQNANPALAPHVVNNSWGCPAGAPPAGENCNPLDILQQGVATLRSAGIMFVAAAGNSGSSCGSISDPPAIYPESFTVGNSNSSDTMSASSSRGPSAFFNQRKPDVVAPGTAVRSSVPPANYANFNGTSMAAPHVAGAAALLMSAFPVLKRDPDTVEQLLRDTAVPIVSTQTCGGILPSFYPNNVVGFGRIDVLAAYQRALATLDSSRFVNGFEN